MDLIAHKMCALDHFELLERSANVTVPHVSECAQLSVLKLVPSLFVILASPLVLYGLSKSDNGTLYRCSPTTYRIIFCGAILVTSSITFFMDFFKWLNSDLYPASTSFLSVLPGASQYVALTLVLVLLIGCRNRGVVSSGVIFNYWLLFAICAFHEFRSTFDAVWYQQGSAKNGFDTTLCMVTYPLVLLELVLSCFADTPQFKIDEKNACPEESSSFLNQITFHWFTGLALKGNRRPLQVSDLWRLNAHDESRNLMSTFDKYWQPKIKAYYTRKREATGETRVRDSDIPSVIWSLFQTYRLPFLSGAAFKFLFDLLQFAAPQLLSMLISFTEDKSQPLWMGVGISLTMFLVAIFQSFILHQYFHTMFALGMNIRSVLMSTVYTKALSLSNSARKNRTVGEIVNLMSVDIQRFQEMTSFVNLFWSAPLQVGLSIFFLWRLLGISVLAGLFILIAMIPFNSWVSVLMRRLQVEQMKYKDERLKLMSEVLNGVKVLKLYAWEDSMQKMILGIRQKEILVLRKLAFYNAVITLSWSCAPFLVAVLTFGMYVNLDPMNNVLTPQVTFVGLSLFNILRFPLAIFAMIFSQAVQCMVSNKRVLSFLADDEIDQFVTQGVGSQRGAVSVKNGNFSWNAFDTTLRNINVDIKPGQLVAVVGSVGSGKSSLLSAILGEIGKEDGEVSLSGSVAYVAQQAWIQNMTLRDNIIFNKSYSAEFYNTVIEACAMGPDLLTLPAGDSTEIGEKGINLSGGQKQRVSLARAVYCDADIVLLDDPLSAVDAHVGKHLFEHVIATDGGLLAKKTRILVTHGLHYLKHCDLVVVMSEGKISETGTYEELMASQGAFADFLEEFLIEEARQRGRSVSFGEQEDEVYEVIKDLERIAPDKGKRIQSQLSREEDMRHRSSSLPTSSPTSSPTLNSTQERTSSRFETTQLSNVEDTDRMAAGTDDQSDVLLVVSKPAEPADNEKSKLVEKEKVEIGKVKWSVYTSYIHAIGYLITVLFLSIYVVSSILGVLSNLWLARWSDHAKQMNASSPEEHDTNVRLSIYASLGLGQALFVCTASVIMALGMVHASRTLHEGILGNILHSPMHFFDITPIGRILNRFGKDISSVDSDLPNNVEEFLCSWQEMITTMIIIIAVLPPLLLPFVCCAATFLLLLRFYVSTSRQLKRLESTTRSPIYSHFQESVQGAASIRAYRCIDRFVEESQKRVDDNLVTYYPSIVANRWLAVRLELIGNLIVLCSAIFAVYYRDNGTLTAGLVGLSVSYALNITQTLNWAVRMTSELETNIVAVERIKEYTESPTEGTNSENLHVKPEQDWPTKGDIEIENLYLRYRENLDFVLRDLSAHINGGEKIGIVGRTGAGKSSLTLALFRIVEADRGCIKIDGHDISQMPLSTLRSRLTIVPQDPVLFSGTLRMNLDPFERFDDAVLWDALRMAHLAPYVTSLTKKLEHQISEGGENLSVGQRQLICLARALLRKTKVLILDEAAASVDMETDALIQKTIREQFVSCTVLTIAHRLNTVMDSDRVLVLDAGKVREFDAPNKLLADHESLFYSMAQESGVVS